MLTTEVLKRAVCTVVDEQDFSRFQKERLKKKIRKVESFEGLDIPPEWAWRICAARLMDGELDWWGWECRSDVIWDLCNKEWQFPRWDGVPKKLYLVAEQGIGDELLFSVAYKRLLKHNRETTIEIDSRLIPAMKRTFGDYFEDRWEDGVISHPVPLGVPRGTYDAFMPCGNALKLFMKTPADFPGPWIKMDGRKKRKWRNFLSNFPKPHIGVSWTGRQGDLDPGIFPEGSFNLNYDGTEGHIKPEFKDFDDMWHFIAVLDSVDTVTNTTLHMSGSIGVPTNVIKPPPKYGEVNNRLAWQFGKMAKWLYPQTKIFNSAREYGQTKERMGVDPKTSR